MSEVLAEVRFALFEAENFLFYRTPKDGGPRDRVLVRVQEALLSVERALSSPPNPYPAHEA